jgi:hypothetical protein
MEDEDDELDGYPYKELDENHRFNRHLQGSTTKLREIQGETDDDKDRDDGEDDLEDDFYVDLDLWDGTNSTTCSSPR